MIFHVFRLSDGHLETHETKDGVVLVAELSADDRKNIESWPPEARLYACFENEATGGPGADTVRALLKRLKGEAATPAATR